MAECKLSKIEANETVAGDPTKGNSARAFSSKHFSEYSSITNSDFLASLGNAKRDL